jgi:membrane protease YdiL (CAAX protease family)
MNSVWLLLCLPLLILGYKNELNDLWKYWTLNDLSLEQPRSPWSALIGLTLFNLLLALSVTILVPADVRLTSTTSISTFPYLVLVFAMFLEELIFRGVPLLLGWLVKRITRIEIYIVFGYISSLLFGYLHIFNFVQPVPLYVVLPQTVGGFVFFWMGRRFGFGYAVLAHIFYNSVLFGVELIL